MKRFLIVMFLMCAGYAKSQDIIVTKEGVRLEVYNLEISASAIFYQKSKDADAEIQRIPKKDVLLVKMADGTKIDLTVSDGTTQAGSAPALQRDPVTAIAMSPIAKVKKGETALTARTPDGKELNYQIISDVVKTLAVAKGKYKEEEYVIPYFVDYDGVKYKVTEIAKKAFYNATSIKRVTYPSTLKKIDEYAFAYTSLVSIILPDGLEEIEKYAYWGCNADNKRNPTEEIYIPLSVTKMGKYCFMSCGSNLSPGAKSMATFTSMPSYITEDNSDYYGIDDSAVRDYRSRK